MLPNCSITTEGYLFPFPPPLAKFPGVTSPSAVPSSRLTYIPHCWSTSAPLCTRTGMASWCWFMAARLRAGWSWLSLQLGSAPCRVRKGTNSHKSLHSVAPPRPPSSKSLLEVNCLTQERGEAGSPGPALKTSRHTGDGLKFLSPAPLPPAQQEAPRGTTLLLQQTGSSHRVTDHGFCPPAWKLFGFLCTFLYFFFFLL